MSYLFRVFLSLIFVSSLTGISAQWDSLNLKTTDTLTIDNQTFNSNKINLENDLYVENETFLFLLKSNRITEISFTFNSTNSQILFECKECEIGDTLILESRVYEKILIDTLKRSFEEGIDNEVSYIELDIPKGNNESALLPEGLQYSGSFGRGLTAGNSQSLVLNSNFNMQLGGTIGDNIGIRAVISDANIPIQAEGTTQQLQEFDQVFIELKKDNQTLNAGDFRLNRPNSYFINYSKKLKGIQYINENIYDGFGKLSVDGSFSISGGKFHRQKINITEGNQGPYKLQGADNEQFIIVQSGTERVYIDGELLVRGESNDYIIFYDRAEIIFTEKRMIQNDFNVVVEFEYLVQNYARSIRNVNAKWEVGKQNFQFFSYVESDNKNSTGVYDLTPSDREILSLSGDSKNAFQSGIFIPQERTSSGVFYKIETVGTDTILSYDQDTTKAIYQAIFTDLGANQGSYIIDNEVNTNGRVYKYVGEGNGRYEPVKKLIAPETKQMYGLSHAWNYSKNGRIRTEVSLSQFDKNLFSKIDDNDNVGYALKTDWSQAWNSGKNGKFSIGISGEFLQRDFNFVNPYRNSEFTIDWNVKDLEIITNELLGNGSLAYAYKSKNKLIRNADLALSSKVFRRQSSFLGTLQSINGIVQSKSITFRTRTSYLDTKSSSFNSYFFRPNVEINKRWKKLKNIKTGILYDAEKNIQSDPLTDTLLNSTNTYDELKFFIQSQDSSAIQTEIFYTKRQDKLGYKGVLEDFSFADKTGINITATGKNQRVNFTINYRKLETDERFNNQVKDAENLLGGIDYQYNLWNNLVRGVSNININSGQEPKLEFDYREVAPGEGNYIWIDDGDGIQNQNEFQPAPFSDQGNFIRINLFNNEFEQVYKQDFSQSLLINPIKWKLSKQKWKKNLANLSSQTNIKLSRKDRQVAGIPSFNLWDIDPFQENLVSFVSSVNQSIFWNRGNPSYDLQFNYLRNNTGILLTNGTDVKDNTSYSFKARKNFLRKLDLSISGIRSFRSQNNLNFTQNNYNLSIYTADISVNYRIKNNLETRAKIVYNDKQNILGIENAESVALNVGLSYASKNKTRVDGQVTYNNINYLSADNALIDLVILEGLQKGNNFLWEVRFTKRLINNFDLTLSYNGRKTGQSRIVHVGNAQIRASF